MVRIKSTACLSSLLAIFIVITACGGENVEDGDPNSPTMGGSSSSSTSGSSSSGVKTEAAVVDVCGVAALSNQDGFVPGNTTDGDLGTRWSAQGAGQWLQYDLCNLTSVSQINVAFYDGDQRTTAFDIEVSSDGNAWQSVFSGRSSGSTLELETFDVTPGDGKYLRLIGNGNSKNDWNSITEVQIVGAAPVVGSGSSSSSSSGFMVGLEECPSDIGWPTLVRLNESEYGAAVQALGAGSSEFDALGAERIGPAQLTPLVSETMATAYRNHAEKLSPAIADAAIARSGCELSATACRDKVVTDIVTRAFRVSSLPFDLKKSFTDLFDAEALATNHQNATRAVVEAALQSPLFLYHTTKSVAAVVAPGNAGAVQANRLAFAVSGGPPDAALMSAGQAGQITPDAARNHAARLLANQQVKDQFADRVWSEWLGLHYSPETRPDLGDQEKALLQSEAQAFVREHAWGPNLSELLQAEKDGRKGILMHKGWLSRYAHGDESAPISRGVFIRNELLCQYIPPPAMAVEFPELVDNLSLKEMLELHTSEPGCAGCHLYFDDLGVAFENFDQNGLLRSNYHNGRQVETDGTLIGTSLGETAFTDSGQLIDLLSQSTEFYNCAAENWVRSATRNLEKRETSCMTKKLGASLSAGMSTTEMLLQTVSSNAFLAVEE